MNTLQRRRMMMAQGVTYDGIPLRITNIGDEPSTLVVEHIIEHELYYKESAKSFYKPFPDNNTLTIPSGETIHIFGYFIDVNQSNYAHFTFTGGQIHLEGSIRAIKSKASSVDSYPKASYYSLFSQNLNIISTSRDLFKEFNGVSLQESMFAFIFDGCSNLETAPDLYGNNHLYAFEGSFRNCSSLKKLPVIYCNRAKVGTFRYTFMGCSSMDMVEEVTVPSVGGTSHTYISMFEGCKSLTKVPNFTENGVSYCSSMFNDCTNITDASNITLGIVGKEPASTAYKNMFAGCTNLVHAPKILITTLGNERPEYWGAFRSCFSGCIKLDKLEVNFNAFTPSNFNYWMEGVSPTGTFTCPKELGQALEGYYQSDGTWVEPTVSRGENTVPPGWYIDFPIIDARGGDANSMALLTALVEYGLCPRGEYLMNSEADKITRINSVFNNNKQITDFTSFQFFNGIKILGAGNEATSPFANSTLTRIILPNTLNKVNNYAFYNCSSLEYISIGKNITLLSDRAFYLCNNLSRADYRGTLEDWLNVNTYYLGNPMSVGADLYINGELLAGGIVIPESITHIKQRILEGGKYITSITINHEITRIEGSAFAGCSSLAYIVLNSNTPPTLKSLAIPSQTIVYVPDNSVETYKSADVWSKMADRIKPISQLPQ